MSRELEKELPSVGTLSLGSHFKEHFGPAPSPLLRHWCCLIIREKVCFYPVFQILFIPRPSRRDSWTQYKLHQRTSMCACDLNSGFSLFHWSIVDLHTRFMCVLISAMQQNSSICIHIYTLFFISFSIMAYHRIFLISINKYSALCYMVGPCCFSILYIIASIC